jgi:adenylyl-sulfate kinase
MIRPAGTGTAAAVTTSTQGAEGSRAPVVAYLRAHRGGVVWLTGLSGSGKSTIACRLKGYLAREGVQALVVDGDSLRLGLCSDLGFDRADRAENVRRAVEVARLVSAAGLVCIVAMISPYEADRVAARAAIGRDARGPLPFCEVFVDAPLTCCEARDVKGLYSKARAGQIAAFTGVSDVYEPPSRPDVRVDTSTESIESCVVAIMNYVVPRLTP